jgi:hypothetical protein
MWRACSARLEVTEMRKTSDVSRLKAGEPLEGVERREVEATERCR